MLNPTSTDIKSLYANVGSASVSVVPRALLFVSPEGDNTDGSTWDKAYTTIQGALDAASTDATDCTVFAIAPHSTFYDIDTVDPTWTGNYEFICIHRRWAIIKNTAVGATAVFKFTGKVSMTNFAIVHPNMTGISFTKQSFRLRKTGLNSLGSTSACTAVHIDGSAGTTIMGGRLEDVKCVGTVGYTTAVHIDNTSQCDFTNLQLHSSLVGIHIEDALSINNDFRDIIFDSCAKGLLIDSGAGQNFNNITFDKCTTSNIDDSAGSHTWHDIKGEIPIDIYPEDLTGTEITAGDTVWGSDTELRSVVTATKPFKIIGYTVDPSHEETTMIRLSADSGTTFFVTDIFSSKKGKAAGSGDATDFIFNAGTRISASVFSPSAGRTVNIWLQVQEI